LLLRTSPQQCALLAAVTRHWLLLRLRLWSGASQPQSAQGLKAVSLPQQLLAPQMTDALCSAALWPSVAAHRLCSSLPCASQMEAAHFHPRFRLLCSLWQMLSGAEAPHHGPIWVVPLLLGLQLSGNFVLWQQKSYLLFAVESAALVTGHMWCCCGPGAGHRQHIAV
jgi:hypothetical protein